jgi:hypothetical protein
MASKQPHDKEQIGDTDDAELFLISNRFLPRDWQSFQRRELTPARERLGPLRPLYRETRR